jgi:hypothetical protein
MSAGASSAASIRARIWERVGNPLEWNDVHKALIILSAAACFLLVFLPRNLYLIDHPEIEPYISRAALAHMRDVGIGYVAFAAVMIPIGLLVRHTKRWKHVYLHVANQSWWLLFAWAAYLVGLVTSPERSRSATPPGCWCRTRSPARPRARSARRGSATW